MFCLYFVLYRNKILICDLPYTRSYKVRTLILILPAGINTYLLAAVVVRLAVAVVVVVAAVVVRPEIADWDWRLPRLDFGIFAVRKKEKKL